MSHINGTQLKQMSLAKSSSFLPRRKYSLSIKLTKTDIEEEEDKDAPWIQMRSAVARDASMGPAEVVRKQTRRE